MLTTDQRHEAAQDMLVIAEVLAFAARGRSQGASYAVRGQDFVRSLSTFTRSPIREPEAMDVIRAVEDLERHPTSPLARRTLDDWLAYAVGLHRNAPAPKA